MIALRTLLAALAALVAMALQAPPAPAPAPAPAVPAAPAYAGVWSAGLGTAAVREIPAGVRDGQRIRLTGQGAPGMGGAPNGDLYLILRIGSDPAFERRGDDLHVEQPVSVYTLVLGGEVTVPTMTGQIDVKVPAGSQNGRTLRVPGKGMPKQGGGHGDLYVRLSAQVPTMLTDRERELFEELAQMAKSR